jgi:hypothetical protein
MMAGAQRLDHKGWLSDPVRRQLLGLEIFEQGGSQGGKGTNPYSPAWTETHPRQGTRW